nr:DUF2441 domain-containing protein [uncultured Lachnoclostridium sp.]
MIKTCYHIDRANSLKEGMTLKLSKNSLAQEYNSEVYQKLFPNGVSLHGSGFLGNLIPNANVKYQYERTNSIYCELHAEFVRRSLFPQYPPRYECFFGVSKLEELKYWSNSFGNDFPIFEIFYDDSNAFEFDAKYLNDGFTWNLETSEFLSLNSAFQYWNSFNVLHKEKPELLIHLPVKVGKCIGLTGSTI